MQRFVGYAATKRAIYEKLNRDSEMFPTAREAIYGADRPLFDQAQQSGAIRCAHSSAWPPGCPHLHSDRRRLGPHPLNCGSWRSSPPSPSARKHLFVYEAHPAVPLWSWDEDEARIREDRSYLAESHLNDSFPANGAREWQWTLGDIVTAVVTAGLEITLLQEYAEPFWRPADGPQAAAWQGHFFALLARRKS